MTDEQNEDRRAHDRTHTDIRELILKTDAPKDKAMLLILLKISESLEANTLDTQEIKQGLKELNGKYELHEVEDKVRTGSIKFGWRVFAGALIVLQGATALVVKSHIDEDVSIKQSVVVLGDYARSSIGTLRRDVDLLQERRRIEDEVYKRKDQVQ